MSSAERTFGGNHLGISKEELIYDENDPSWLLLPSSEDHISIEQYAASKELYELELAREMKYGLQMVEDRERLREARLKIVSEWFDEKKEQYLKKRHEEELKKEPKKLMCQKVLELAASPALNTITSQATAASNVQFFPSLSPIISELSRVARIFSSGDSTSELAPQSIEASAKEPAAPSSAEQPETSQKVIKPECSSQPSSPSKSIHPTLTRTDSSALKLKLKLKEQNEKSSLVMIKVEPPKVEEEKHELWPYLFFKDEINLALLYEKNNKNMPKTLQYDIKSAVRQTVAKTTKTRTSKEEIERTSTFFIDLLSGRTVYGFNDKVINLNNDEIAMHFAASFTLEAYTAVLKQDSSLCKTIAKVLNVIARALPEFAKLMFGKLFLESPLLKADHDSCALSTFNEIKRWESVAEGLTSWRSDGFAIMNLFMSLILDGDNIVTQKFEYSSYGIFWQIAAALCRSETPFAAALLSNIISKHGKIMAQLYGKQFTKMLNLISKVCIPMWNNVVKECDSHVGNAMSICITALGFALKEYSHV